MTIIVLVLLIVAAVLFLMAAINVASPKFSLIAAGLLFWVVAVIVQGVQAGIH